VSPVRQVHPPGGRGGRDVHRHLQNRLRRKKSPFEWNPVREFQFLVLGRFGNAESLEGVVKILSGVIFVTICLTESALAQAPQGDQSDHQLAPQQRSQQYVPPPLSPAERARCRLHRPALNVASRRACRAIKGR
jgi:hypothetical protein